MKLWRKLAKKDESGKRNGRQIAYEFRMGEQMNKYTAKTYPLLEALYKRAGITYALTKKQQEILKQMAAEAAAQETVDETK